MAATCGVGMLVYILPMLLGRTYDMQLDKVGIDIYDKADIDKAKSNPIPNPQVNSNYMTIERSSDKRDFIGVSGELALKVSAGLVDIRGAGEYLKDASKQEKSVEILIKLTFTTMTVEISPDAKPLKFWELLKKESVGTHVVTALTYGGEVYASVNFVAHRSEDLQDIRAQVMATISKSGAFDIEAQGKLDMLSRNLSSKAKMEIDYYATVPLDTVPTTIDALNILVNNFKDQVEKINDGNGVAICAEMRPLSDFKDDFIFRKNRELLNSLDDFNYQFENLREAKAILKSLVSSLPENVPDDYLKKVVDFSDRLTKTLMKFHDVIGNMDLTQSPAQLDPAVDAFDANSKLPGDSRYSIEINRIANQSVTVEDEYIPRGTFVLWGKRSCGIKASNLLYIGIMASFYHEGIGAGTQFQCLPENPNFNVDPDATGTNELGSKLAGVRYKYLSVFAQGGKAIEDKVASCTVCETLMRPTIKMFPAASGCPPDWVQEYTGYMVSGKGTFWSRTEYICLDYDPDYYNSTVPINSMDPAVVPIKMGDQGVNKRVYSTGSSLPCVVCSK